MTMKKKRISAHDRMTVTVPEGEVDGLRVKRFEVKPYDLNNLREALRTGRQTRPGWYTKLYDTKTNTFWMSDTDAEKGDHMMAVRLIEFDRAERVLINGLGLGMVLAAALSFDHVTQIDVVEKEQRVIDLIGPHYTKDPRVNLIRADAVDQMKAWPRGTRWDVGWTDIWPELSTENIPEQDQFHRFYRRRCQWHGCWGRETLMRMRKQERAEKRRYEEWYS